ETGGDPQTHQDVGAIRLQGSRRHDTDDCQERQYQRQLEGDAEGQKEVSDECEIVVGGDDLDEMPVVEAQEPVDRLAQGDEPDAEPGDEQSDAWRSRALHTSSRAPSKLVT